MKTKTTVILLLAVCVLAAFLKLMHDRSSGAAKTGDRLLAGSFDDITWIAIEKGGVTNRCEKTRDGWMLAGPVRARADAGRMAAIISSLERARRTGIVTPAQMRARALSLDSYSLGDSPETRLSFGGGAGTRTLLVGRELLGTLYVREEGSPLVVATDSLEIGKISADARDLRDRMVMAGGPERAARLEIALAGGGFLQVARKDGTWVMQQPVKGARLNTRRVNELFREIFGLKAERFVEQAVAVETGLDENQAAVRIGLWLENEGTPRRLFLGKETDGGNAVYAGSPDDRMVFTVRKSFMDAVTIDPRQLRDRALFALDPERVTRLTLREGDKSVEFRRGTNDWFTAEPRRWKADGGRIETILATVVGLSAEEFVDGAATNDFGFGSTNAARSIGMVSGVQERDGGTAAARVLVLGALVDGGKSMYCRFADEDSVAKIPAERLLAVLAQDVSGVAAPGRWVDPLAYWDRTVLEIDPADVTGLSLERRGDKREQNASRDESGVWNAAPPESGKAVPDVAADVMAAGARLRALRFETVSASGLESYGLAPPAARLTFVLRGERGIRKTVLFGFRAGTDGIYAMIQGQDVVFVLPKDLVEKLLRDLVTGVNHGS